MSLKKRFLIYLFLATFIVGLMIFNTARTYASTTYFFGQTASNSNYNYIGQWGTGSSLVGLGLSFDTGANYVEIQSVQIKAKRLISGTASRTLFFLVRDFSGNTVCQSETSTHSFSYNTWVSYQVPIGLAPQCILNPSTTYNIMVFTTSTLTQANELMGSTATPSLRTYTQPFNSSISKENKCLSTTGVEFTCSSGGYFGITYDYSSPPWNAPTVVGTAPFYSQSNTYTIEINCTNQPDIEYIYIEVGSEYDDMGICNTSTKEYNMFLTQGTTELTFCSADSPTGGKVCMDSPVYIYSAQYLLTPPYTDIETNIEADGIPDLINLPVYCGRAGEIYVYTDDPLDATLFVDCQDEDELNTYTYAYGGGQHVIGFYSQKIQGIQTNQSEHLQFTVTPPSFSFVSAIFCSSEMDDENEIVQAVQSIYSLFYNAWGYGHVLRVVCSFGHSFADNIDIGHFAIDIPMTIGGKTANLLLESNIEQPINSKLNAWTYFILSGLLSLYLINRFK